MPTVLERQTVRVTPTGAALGADIGGVDLAQALSPKTDLFSAGVLLWEQGIIYTLALGLGVAMGVVFAVAALPSVIFTTGSLQQIVDTLDAPPIQTVVPWPAVGAVLGGLLLLWVAFLAENLMDSLVGSDFGTVGYVSWIWRKEPLSRFPFRRF